MDLSKIPGQNPTAARPATPQPPPPPNSAAESAETQPPPFAQPATPHAATPHAPRAAHPSDLWYSPPESLFAIGVGVILMYLTSRFFEWLMHVIAGGPFTYTFQDVDGSPITYPHTWFFIADLPVAILAFAMILEGLAMGLLRKRFAAWLTVAFLGLAGVTAVAAQIYLFPKLGLQLMLLLAALMGIYLAWSAALRLKDAGLR